MKPTSKIKVFVFTFGAAIVGTFVWSFITSTTGYEIGYVAWGIGALVGFAVMLLANGEDNVVIPLISAAAALFGVMFVKYLAFFPIYNDDLSELSSMSPQELEAFDIDAQYLAEIPMLSPPSGLTEFLDYR